MNEFFEARRVDYFIRLASDVGYSHESAMLLLFNVVQLETCSRYVLAKVDRASMRGPSK